MDKLLQQANELQEELVAWRRQLHQNPEVGLELPDTTAFVIEKLESFGYAPQPMAGGVVATVGGARHGKCFLLRADMDALPVAEETDLPFKSENGCMHACGHDLHTTMLLGAARLLKAREDQLQGTVKLMFQPGEELLAGARGMIEAGVLEHPQVDAAAMFHVMTGMPFPPGLLVVPQAGPFTTASDHFEIDIHGKGGHGAMPETTVDSLLVMSHIHLALQAIRSREIAGGDFGVVTVGSMHGGEANNVIPDSARMTGTVRTYDPEVRRVILERIRAIAGSTAETFRARAEVRLVAGCPALVNNGGVAADLREQLAGVFGPAVPDPALLGTTRLSGSEDFAFVTERVPGVMLVLSAGDSREGRAYPMHHPRAVFEESVLCTGAAAYAAAAMGWLERNK